MYQPFVYISVLVAMPDLTFIISQYGLLKCMALCLSALDLFNVGLTCHDLYSCILRSKPVFCKLKRLAICDGRGLNKRQNFVGLYKSLSGDIAKSYLGGPRFDEEVEVRLYNLKCDASNALPCLKCGVNVCEVGSLALNYLVGNINLTFLRSADTCHE